MVTKEPQLELCHRFLSCNACTMIDEIYSFPGVQLIFSVLPHTSVLDKDRALLR